MMMEEDDFGLMQVVDVSMEEDQIHSNFIQAIFTGDKNDILAIAKKIMATSQQSSKFKHEVHKLPIKTRFIFSEKLYDNICEIITDVRTEKRDLKQLFNSSFFQFVFLLEKPKISLSEKLHYNFLQLSKIVEDLGDFYKIMKYLIKITRSIDKSQKREQLICKLYLLITKSDKDQKNNDIQQFKINKKLLAEEDSQSDQQLEKKILIKLLIMDFLNTSQNPVYKPTEEDSEKLLKILYEKPFKGVLEYSLKNYKLNSFSKKIRQQILACGITYENARLSYTYPNCKLHPDLLNNQSLQLAIENADETIFRAMKKQCVIVVQDKICLKYTTKMVKKMKSIIKNQIFSPSQQSLNNLLDLVKFFAGNLDKKFRTPGQAQKSEMVDQKQEDEQMRNFFAQLVYIFSKYFMTAERGIQVDMQTISQKLSEKTIIQLLNISLKWIHEHPTAQSTTLYTLSFVSFLAHLFIREQYNSIISYKSEVSLLIRQVLTGIKSFTNEWKNFKKIKIILQRWGETASQNCSEYSGLVRKFLTFYFDEKTSLKNVSRSIFSPLLASRGYMLIVGNEAGKKIIEILETEAKPDDPNQKSQEQLQKINQYLYKFSFFYSARIKLPSTDRAADLMYKLYQRYAHKLPLLYNLRTWIINYSNLSKDDASSDGINQILKEIKDKQSIVFFKSVRQYSVQQILTSNFQNQTAKNYLEKIKRLINNMELKSHIENYRQSVYSQCITILKEFNDLNSHLYNKLVKNFAQQNQSSNKSLEKCFFETKKCIYRQIQTVTDNFANIFRFYLCNLNRLIDPKEQIALIKASSQLFEILADKKEMIELKDVLLICDIFGFSQNKPDTHLKKSQILKSSVHRYGGAENSDQFLMNKEQFIPINIISVAYNQIRKIFPAIIKNMISLNQEKNIKQQGEKNIKNKLKKQYISDLRPAQLYSIQSILTEIEQEKSKTVKDKDRFFGKTCEKIIKNIMFPTINTFGPCCFNNKLEDKGKQQHAFGIYWDQFQTLISQFSSRQIANLHSQIMLILDACHLKDCVITNKQGFTNNTYRNRPLDQNRRISQEIIKQLVLMGISQQYVQIALQNVQNPDPDSVFQWIQNNPEKLAIEQSRREATSQKMSKNPMIQEKTIDLQLVNYSDFVKNVNKGTKNLIRKLFQQLYSDKGDQVKDILFICLDSFKEQTFRNKKYEQLADKIFQELDQLNREFSSHKLSIIVGSLQHIISKRPNIIIKMHEKCITLKLLSFMGKTNQQVGERILQAINKTLPMPTQKCTEPMIKYLLYIADVLMTIQIKSDTQSQILYKMTKACHQQLNKKVLAVVCRGLGKGYIKNQIFPLLSIVLESDIKFAEANVQFDIKSFILENVDIEKMKSNLLEVDAKKFSKSFLKFQNSEHLSTVCKRLFFKKKNRTNLFYDQAQHPLFKSEVVGCSFLSYNLSSTQRIIVSNMVNLIVNSDKLSEQTKYVQQLYKTLQFYKILIPYCMKIQVEGITFFQWLLSKQFPKGKGDVICFLTFLLVRNGLFFDKDNTFSDYLMAKIIINFSQNSAQRKQKWTLLALVYFLQIKNFNRKACVKISKQNQSSFKKILEKELLQEDSKPAQYVLISEALYLIHQNQLIESLLQKYKINDIGQFTLEKQFLNMDLFYVRSNQRKNNNRVGDGDELDQLSRRLGILRSDRNTIILGIDGNEQQDIFDDEADNSNLLRQIIMRRTLHRDQHIVQSSSSIFIPREQSEAQQINRIQQQSLNQNNLQENNQEMQEQRQQTQNQQQAQKKKQHQMEQEKVEEPEQLFYLKQIIQKFQAILIEATQMESDNQLKLPRIPQIALKASDLEQTSYNINIKEPRTLLDQKFQKTNIFKERIKQIVCIVDPKGSWNNQNEQTKAAQLPQARNNNNNENNMIRQYMLSRLGVDRQRERRTEGTDQIHMGRIFTMLTDYQEHQRSRVEHIAQGEKVENHNESQKKEVEKLLQKQKVQKIQQQKPENKNVEASLQQRMQLKQKVQMDEKDGQQLVVNESKQQKVQEMQKAEQQKPNIEAIVQQMIPENGQANQLQQGQQIVQQQPRQRQILNMLGLSQNFLRDCGLDQQLFDSLPEDMQIEQLNHFMQTQRANQQSQANNSQAEGQNSNPVLDLQNQNAAFIASLDSQLRGQTLMQATPEFLMTLPPQMRAEAENHRQRFIGRIIENEQLDEEQQLYSRDKVEKEIKYPEINQQSFPQIHNQTAKQLSKNILIRFPKFNIEGMKILLENKKTQKTAVNTLICYARNITTITLTNYTFNQQSGQWLSQTSNPSGAVRKFLMELILDTLYENTSKCIFKDEKFLKGPANYQCFCQEKLPVNNDLGANETEYYPLYQIIDLCLDNSHFNFAAQLMKKVTELPTSLKKKIIRGFKDDKFSQEFYKNLNGLSEDKEMKALFLSEFPDRKSAPKYQTLSRLLKYQFGRVPYLKQLHGKALQQYKDNPTPQLSEFLSEIFVAYTIQDVKQYEQIFLENKQSHFQIIKYLYSKGRVLDKQPIGLILQLPHLLDFETKRFIFQNNPRLNKHRSRLMIQINRRNLFMESYNQIMSHTARQLQNRIKVQFQDEPAEDAGGVKKQWFLEVSRQIFNRQYALFQPSQSGNTYQPNPKSYVNPEHLNYFKFIGRFAAKALSQGMLIDAFFTGSFYKMILGQQLELKDLEQQDYNFYKSMLWLKENKLEGDEYTFSYVIDYFGKLITKQLIPDGQNIPVTQQRKQEFIQKYSLAIMHFSISTQIQKFLQGFYQILPKEYISFFGPKQLELLMSGLPTIDLNDLKQNTDYAGYNATDKQIVWYWQILEEYSSEELAHLIQFITGTSKIPLQGFSQIQGMNGVQKISIHKDSHTHQLPRSHTCFNQLDLPAYQSKQVMKQKLRVAITWGSAGFGFM